MRLVRSLTRTCRKKRKHWQAARLASDSLTMTMYYPLCGSTLSFKGLPPRQTTIDWMHDLVKDSYRQRGIRNGKGFVQRALASFDACSGWFVAALIGSLTACVAFLVDITEATISDYKTGYCRRNLLMSREACCEEKTPFLRVTAKTGPTCEDWHEWTSNWWAAFAIYGGLALLFGVISSGLTMLTKRALPAATDGNSDRVEDDRLPEQAPAGKTIYMAAGSGIPEIKTILSGFIIPHFLDLRVLIVKAVGSAFAVATGMCLGKEGPFVHISACVAYLVAKRFPKYRENGRKMREMLSAGVASGLSVAFGAPIGGVLFSYEEISTYFPRKVLWRAFICSMFAAMILKALNPNGTGKLVLFETNYGTQYLPQHYLVFVLLGVAGGVWGGLFCKLNFIWSKWFRSYAIIKNNPVFEVFLVVLVTVLLQYPNPLTKEPGDIIIKNLLVDCKSDESLESWLCMHENRSGGRWEYTGWLALGCLVKLVLTIVTFGSKVPSGIIIPALDAGAFFGRLVGQWVGTISPGIFAMVGAGAFLAGVSRMTLSLCVIMFELTGELEYILPHMIAILVAKWVADSLSSEGVYDLAQTVLGHPFLDMDHAVLAVQRQSEPHTLRRLIPPKRTMEEITVNVPKSNTVGRAVLERKLKQLLGRGLMDAGLALTQHGIVQGYIAQGELEFGLHQMGRNLAEDVQVRLLGDKIDVGTETRRDEEERLDMNGHCGDSELDLSSFVDRTPLSICEAAPMEYAVECFAKLGLRHLMITQEGTGKLVGVVIKKRMVQYLESLH